MQNKQHPTWIELSRSALNHNLDQISSMLGPACKLGLVVKGNAYGHGLVPFTSIAAEHPKTSIFFVGYIEEALSLRMHGITQRICSFIPVEEFLWEEAIMQDIELVCPDESYLHRFATAANKVGKKARLHIKVDTGLARLGILPHEVEAFLALVSRYQREIELVGVMTHLADVVSDEIGAARAQCALFESIHHLFNDYSNIELHACASGSVCLLGRDTLMRIGTSAYGYWKSPAQRARTLALFPHTSWQPVMTWKTRVMHVKQVAAGTPIGYGHSFTAPCAMELATLPVGYADGYPRSLSNKGFVRVRGELVPIIGRISMNLMTVDVTRFGGAVDCGEEVTLLGPWKGISADDLAMQTETINLDILSRVRATIPRLIV